jgi:two-component system response regulator AtoC
MDAAYHLKPNPHVVSTLWRGSSFGKIRAHRTALTLVFGGTLLRPTVFVVDDDQTVRNYLFTFLAHRGYQSLCFETGEQLLSRLSEGAAPGLILMDVVMPDCDGVAVMHKVRNMGSTVPVVMLSGYHDIRTVVESMRLGAINFLLKPFEEEVLDNILNGVFSDDKALSEYGEEFLTTNPAMLQMAHIVGKVAHSDVPILILGESGVGKEVLARFAHRRSPRKDKPFVKINCAALPHELLESELFGYERGAFTGALNEKIGKFELADGGTLLLDEIGEMSAHLQSKLLHVLQDGTFSRLGARKTTRVDVRVIAATNIKLEKAIVDGTFRGDLYYRLNVIRVDLPALRDRIEDVPRLCSHFVNMYREKYRSSVTEIPDELLECFAKFNWPGNIRQLENVIKRYLILKNSHEIMDELGGRETPAPPQPAESGHIEESLLTVGLAAAEHAERQLVERTLAETRGNRKQAARRLKISYKGLLNKLKRWNGPTKAAQMPDDMMRAS